MAHWSLPIILGAALAAAPAGAEIARIKSASGKAVIERGQARIAARPGLALNPGDVLVTGRGARMGLTFIDNSRFAVGPNSRVAVSEFSFDRRTQRGAFVTRVDRGSLGIVSGQIAKSGRDAMKVRTPTSLLGVRGTRFVIEVK